MNFDYRLPALIVGAAIVIVQPQLATALTLDEVNAIARKVTVLIDGEYPGSGVIIGREGNTYYVLTAKHVVNFEDKYQIVTPDEERYALDYSTVKKLPDVDLAVLQFKSDRNYKVATLADYDSDTRSRYAFISGWPAPGPSVTERIRLFIPGLILDRDVAIALANDPLSEGYGLFYTNITAAGMSGGPVLDTAGRVIGIHGRSEGEKVYDDEHERTRRLKLGFSSGIPIQIFLRQLHSVGIRLPVSVNSSPPPQLSRQEASSIESFLKDLPLTLAGVPNAITWTNYGNLLYRLDRLPEALSAFDKAIQIQPDFHQAWYARGVLLSAMKRYEEAIASYDKTVQFNPNFYLALRNRGTVLTTVSRYKDALTSYDQALQIQPDSYTIWYMRGDLLSRNLQQYEEALLSYNKALQIKPDFSQVWMSRGWTLTQLGRYQEALESVDKALKITPNNRSAQELRTSLLQKAKTR